MKRFLIQSAIFASLVLLFLTAGEILIRTSPNSYTVKHSLMTECPERFSTAFIGSSHAFYGIKPSCFGDSAINLANISQNYEYDYELLKKFIPVATNLKRVIIPISYHSLPAADFEDSNDWFMARYYKMYMDVDLHSDFSIYNVEISDPEVYSGKIKSILFNSRRGLCDSLGFGVDFTVATKPDNWDSFGPERAESHSIDNPTMTAGNIERLDSMMALCVSHGVRPILVTTPTWHTYYDNLEQSQLATMTETAKCLSSRYSTVWLNYLTDKRFVPDDFFDADHLSDVGACKLAGIISRDIEQLKL